MDAAGKVTYLTYLGGGIPPIVQSLSLTESGQLIAAGYTYASDFPAVVHLRDAFGEKEYRNEEGSGLFVTVFEPGGQVSSSTVLEAVDSLLFYDVAGFIRTAPGIAALGGPNGSINLRGYLLSPGADFAGRLEPGR